MIVYEVRKLIYSGEYKITKEEDLYYKDLLEQNLEDENHIGLKDDYIGIATIDFKNGNYITVDLASGCSNYYDNICLYDKDGNELYCSDCNFEIDSFELFYDEDTYVVKKIVE